MQWGWEIKPMVVLPVDLVFSYPASTQSGDDTSWRPNFKTWCASTILQEFPRTIFELLRLTCCQANCRNSICREVTKRQLLGAGMLSSQHIPKFGERNSEAISFGQPEGNQPLPLRL
jgi:hypothetical protein